MNREANTVNKHTDQQENSEENTAVERHTEAVHENFIHLCQVPNRSGDDAFLHKTERSNGGDDGEDDTVAGYSVTTEIVNEGNRRDNQQVQ